MNTIPKSTSPPPAPRATTIQDDVDFIIQLRNPVRPEETVSAASLYPTLRAEDPRPSRRMMRSRSFGSLNVRLEELMREDERSAVGRLLGLPTANTRKTELKNVPILSAKEKERLEYHSLFAGLSGTQRAFLSMSMAEKLKQNKADVSIRSIILDEDDLLPAWLEFLESNYAIENYHFFVDVLKFRKTVKELANGIYEKYITKSAVEEVNLMWATREGIEKTILEPNVNMWNDAQDEVLMAFESDLLPKFLQSKIYQTWKEKREERRLPTVGRRRSELIEAVRQGAQLEAIQKLLSYNSIYDTDMEGQTALHVAAGRPDSFEVVVYLVAKNADVTAYDVNCWTALHVAANGGHLLTCQFLISKGANIKAETNEGNLAVHYLVKNTYKPEEIPLFLSVLHAMLDEVPNVNHETKKGESVLHYACLSGTPDAAIQTLISSGAKLNIVNKRGNTPLHMAILKRHTSVVKLLLANGADPNLKTKAGSPYDLAKSAKFAPIVELIEAHLATNTTPTEVPSSP